MLDDWAMAWQPTSARADQRYGHTRRREQSEGRSGYPIIASHGNMGAWKAAGPMSLFETRAFEFEHLGGKPAGREPRFESSPFWSQCWSTP
jgi:hypothetical protein